MKIRPLAALVVLAILALAFADPVRRALEAAGPTRVRSPTSVSAIDVLVAIALALVLIRAFLERGPPSPPNHTQSR